MSWSNLALKWFHTETLFSYYKLAQNILSQIWIIFSEGYFFLEFSLRPSPLCYNYEDTRDREGHSSEPVLSGRDDQDIVSVTLMPCTLQGVDSMHLHIFRTYCDDKSGSGRHDFLVSRLQEGLKLSFDWVFIWLCFLAFGRLNLWGWYTFALFCGT